MLPAVIWKLQNIRKLRKISPEKHQRQHKQLLEVLCK
jgi:hypothetical protein